MVTTSIARGRSGRDGQDEDDAEEEIPEDLEEAYSTMEDRSSRSVSRSSALAVRCSRRILPFWPPSVSSS